VYYGERAFKNALKNKDFSIGCAATSKNNKQEIDRRE
jgi:hypothetical protein